MMLDDESERACPLNEWIYYMHPINDKKCILTKEASNNQNKQILVWKKNISNWQAALATVFLLSSTAKKKLIRTFVVVL